MPKDNITCTYIIDILTYYILLISTILLPQNANTSPSQTAMQSNRWSD